MDEIQFKRHFPEVNPIIGKIKIFKQHPGLFLLVKLGHKGCRLLSVLHDIYIPGYQHFNEEVL